MTLIELRLLQEGFRPGTNEFMQLETIAQLIELNIHLARIASAIFPGEDGYRSPYLRTDYYIPE